MSDYSELIKALREYSGCRKGEIARITSDAAAAIEALEAENKEMLHELEDAAKQIRELQDEVLSYASGSQPHWVSVEERLPEVGQLILLYYGGCFSIAARTEDEMYEGKRYWKLEDGYWERIEDDYYWMPIEPPKEDA